MADGALNWAMYESEFPNTFPVYAYPAECIYILCISMCRHVCICVGMHVFASAHRYIYFDTGCAEGGWHGPVFKRLFWLTIIGIACDGTS